MIVTERKIPEPLPNSTHEVGKDAKSAYADPTESGGSDNISADVLDEWITLVVKEVSWFAYVLCKSIDWGWVTCLIIFLPLSKEYYEVFCTEFTMQYFREEVKIFHECNWSDPS